MLLVYPQKYVGHSQKVILTHCCCLEWTAERQIHDWCKVLNGSSPLAIILHKSNFLWDKLPHFKKVKSTSAFEKSCNSSQRLLRVGLPSITALTGFFCYPSMMQVLWSWPLTMGSCILDFPTCKTDMYLYTISDVCVPIWGHLHPQIGATQTRNRYFCKLLGGAPQVLFTFPPNENKKNQNIKNHCPCMCRQCT